MFKNSLHLFKIYSNKFHNLTLKCYVSNFTSTPNNEVMKIANIDPTILKPYFNPKIIQDDYFNLKKLISIEEMFEARVHYGHKIGTLKDNMKWALFGERLDVCIFDLNITEKYLFKALKFLAYMSYFNGIILFIATNRSQMLPTEKFASSIGQYSHTRRWQQETFTNSRAIYGAPVRLPDVVVFFGTLSSVLERHPAVLECAKLAIPTIAIVDSNAEPNYITYPIPGNDDSFDSFNYYKKIFGKAIEAGTNERKKEEEIIIKYKKEKIKINK